MPNTQLVEIVRNQAVTTSLKVADYFGKRHADVIRAIDNILTQGASVSNERQMTLVKMFRKTSYVDAKGEHRPLYQMNFDGFALVTMGFTGKKALEFKLAYVHAFPHVEEDNQLHKEIVDGEEFYVADTLEEFLVLSFGEKIGKELLEHLQAPVEPQKACVYVLKMANGTVKIGVAADFDKRVATLEHASGLEVEESYHTPYIDRNVAYKIENACHKEFAAKRLKGEYFDITFEEARAAVKPRAIS